VIELSCAGRLVRERLSDCRRFTGTREPFSQEIRVTGIVERARGSTTDSQIQHRRAVFLADLEKHELINHSPWAEDLGGPSEFCSKNVSAFWLECRELVIAGKNDVCAIKAAVTIHGRGTFSFATQKRCMVGITSPGRHYLCLGERNDGGAAGLIASGPRHFFRQTIHEERRGRPATRRVPIIIRRTSSPIGSSFAASLKRFCDWNDDAPRPTSISNSIVMATN